MNLLSRLQHKQERPGR